HGVEVVVGDGDGGVGGGCGDVALESDGACRLEGCGGVGGGELPGGGLGGSDAPDLRLEGGGAGSLELEADLELVAGAVVESGDGGVGQHRGGAGLGDLQGDGAAGEQSHPGLVVVAAGDLSGRDAGDDVAHGGGLVGGELHGEVGVGDRGLTQRRAAGASRGVHDLAGVTG